MNAKNIIIVMLLLTLVGCASVDVTKTAKGFYDPTNPNEVEILKTIPDKPYEELGTITAVNFLLLTQLRCIMPFELSRQLLVLQQSF